MKKPSFTALQVRATAALLALFVAFLPARAQEAYQAGIERTGAYYELLHGKRVAVVANATSLLSNYTHTVDHLISLGVEVHAVWAPEHGFRGTADAGAHISDAVDPKTGIPIKSLYGRTKRPEMSWLQEVDFVVYDIQDVGVRFYTYSTTLSYVLDACVEAGVPLVVMDRGNPNGHYVDGPILQPGFESMVGLHPLPVVHGLTMGEYATMVYGERWMPAIENASFREAFEEAGGLRVIPCVGYSHEKPFDVFQTAPSPNLRSLSAIRHYPSLCFFEGTPVSCGRGTRAPFLQFGAPWLGGPSFTNGFMPQPSPGASQPKFAGESCLGRWVAEHDEPANYELDWSHLFDTYSYWAAHKPAEAPVFFTAFFAKLAGSDRLQTALEEGLTVDEWKASYADELEKYLGKRRDYLLYP